MDLNYANECWQKLIEGISGSYTNTQLNTWFKPLTVFYCDEKNLVLCASSDFVAGHVNKNYASQLYNITPAYFGINFENVSILSPADCEAFMRTVNTSRLNPKYTFESFVTGQSNVLAYSASMAVAEEPGSHYNPLFLWGGAGLGKTHLMTAIANFMLLRNPKTNVQFYSSEQFTNEVVEAIRQRKTAEMRERMRSVDILLVDDIQLLAGRNATQEEFFNTFNDLYSRGKQIVISADKSPDSIPTLEERMRSRFKSGIVMPIDKPDFETRIAILKNKAIEDNCDVDDEAIALIAEKIDTNIRELEGTLNTCAFMAGNLPGNGRVTVEIVNACLPAGSSAPRQVKTLTPEIILDEVAVRYRVPPSDILSDRRNREITLPRQMAMYLIREMLSYSTPRIGQFFGRHHSTVMYALRQADKLAASDSGFAAIAEEVRSALK